MGAAIGALLHCHRSEPAPDGPAPAPPASIAQALGIDATVLESPKDPTPPSGDLAADMSRFTSVEACAKEHASLDPLVGDTLRTIGYDNFLRDSCRVLHAAKTKNLAECVAIDASALRAHCERVVAMTAKDPDACPMVIPGEPELGRDATCVAVAARDPRLCAGEEPGRRTACEALSGRDVAKCTGIAPAVRSECVREVSRYRSSLDAPEARDALKPPQAMVDVHGAEGTVDPEPTRVDLSADTSRGVVLSEGRDGARLTLGLVHDTGAASIAFAPPKKVALGVSLVVTTAAAPTDARLAKLELDVPGAPALAVPGARCDVRARVAKLEHVRGGAVELTISGVVGVSPHAYKLNATYVSFVRDVVRAPDAPPTAVVHAHDATPTNGVGASDVPQPDIAHAKESGRPPETE